MLLFVVFVVFQAFAVSIQACPVIPKNQPKFNFLVNIFDAQASTTNLEEIKALLDDARSNFTLPGVPDSMQFESIEIYVRRQQGFCKGDTRVDLVYYTLRIKSPINATFYGCDFVTHRNVKITFIDQMARKEGLFSNLSDVIDRSFNATFCRCEEDWNSFLSCKRDEKLESIAASSDLFLIILASYTGFMLFIVCLYKTVRNICIKLSIK